jgi:hypothetical protein
MQRTGWMRQPLLWVYLCIDGLESLHFSCVYPATAMPRDWQCRRAGADKALVKPNMALYRKRWGPTNRRIKGRALIFQPPLLPPVLHLSPISAPRRQRPRSSLALALILGGRLTRLAVLRSLLSLDLAHPIHAARPTRTSHVAPRRTPRNNKHNKAPRIPIILPRAPSPS